MMAEQRPEQRPEQEQEHSRPTLWQVFRSVSAAMFGVQSEKNRARDMTHGRAGDYIVVGLLATVAFVLVIAGLVRLILYLAR